MQRMQARMRSLAPRIAELQKDIAAKVRSAADEPTAPEQPAIPATVPQQ